MATFWMIFGIAVGFIGGIFCGYLLGEDEGYIDAIRDFERDSKEVR